MIRTIARKVRLLTSHPAFREAPLTVLGRCGVLMAHAALSRPLTFPLTADGERLTVPGNLRYTTVTAYLLRDRLEPDLHFLPNLLGRGGVFVDIGANIGVYALRAASLVGAEGRVIAVEPGAEALEALNRNLALNPQLSVTVVPKALSDHEGEATLHHVGAGYDPQAYSLVPDASAVGGETVPLTTLDIVCRDAGLTRVDVVKIDAEGVEPQVLAGGRETLERMRPIVISEMNSHIQSGRRDVTDQVWRFLGELGYTFHRVVDDRLVTITEPPDTFCNVVARPAA